MVMETGRTYLEIENGSGLDKIKILKYLEVLARRVFCVSLDAALKMFCSS